MQHGMCQVSFNEWSTNLIFHPFHHINKFIGFIFRIKDYEQIWSDLNTFSYEWRRILVPDHCVFDLGVSEAIYSNIKQTAIHEQPSPVIFMRAQKNPTEQKGMQRAHILDGAAMCDAFSLLERRVRTINNIFWTLS